MKGSAFSSSRKIWISCMKALMYLCSGLTGALVLFLMGYVLIKGIPNISWELLSTSPSYLSDRIGILPDLMNTLYIVLATIVIVLPLGVGAAIYLTEYAKTRSSSPSWNMPPKRSPAFRRSFTVWSACWCSARCSAWERLFSRAL